MKEGILVKEQRQKLCGGFISVQSHYNESQLRNFALEEFF